ncbi:MAG: cytochrome P450 [Pseudomonadota bacterium]
MAHTSTVAIPKVSIDPSDSSFVQDPAAAYERFHAIGQPFYWDAYGHVCFASFDAVSNLLRDKRFGREMPAHLKTEPPEHLAPFYDFESRSMLELEPPAHSRLRRLVNRAFVSRQIAALEPWLIELSNTLLDDIARHEKSFDLLPAYAEPIPVLAIARLLGVPGADADRLLAWSHAMVAMYQFGRSRAVEDAAVTATQDFSAYIRDIAAARRAEPQEDLISMLAHTVNAEDGATLSEDELVTTAILLLNAGHEATVHAISNGTKALLENGTNAHKLNAGSDAICEELLRFEAPLHMFTRYALEPCEAYGVKLETGDTIGLLLGAANTDPTRFHEPRHFHPERTDAAHVSFGGGIHFCIGAPLARMELKIALPALFNRFPNLEFAEQPIYANRYHFHGLEHLMLRHNEGA